MTLPQIRKTYLEKGNRIMKTLESFGDMMEEEHIKRLEKRMNYYFVSGNRVQILIDEAPLPTGQVWNLEGRYVPVMVWGKKDA